MNAELVGASLRALLRFSARRRGHLGCNLCGAGIAPDPAHRHLLEADSERVLCACDACATLFGEDALGRYRAVPRDVRALSDVDLSEGDWQALGVPIRLAFFVRDGERGSGGRAVYPSAAGPVTTSLGPEAFVLLESKGARVSELLPRVEALLVQTGTSGVRAYRAPLDVAYRLVGILRSGSTAASGAVERFFSELDERCRRENGA
jgi:hypothetical protein